MNGRARGALGIALCVALVATSVVACEAVLGVDGLRAGAGGAGGTDNSGLARPPARGPQEAPDGGSTVTFALTRIYFGDRDLDGGVDPYAWEQFGYNIDGVPPGSASTFCAPVGGADPGAVHKEGANGIENAFGHFIVQLVVSLDMQATVAYNQALASGNFTYLLTLNDLGSGAGENPLGSHLALGGNLGGPPKLDGTDEWPVVQGTGVDFPNAYLVGDTWVSGSPTDMTFALSVSGVTVQVPVLRAVVSMHLDAAHRTATEGVVSGIVPTAQLEPQILALVGAFKSSLCTDPILSTILMDVAQASDILQDGTQDPTRTCDSITIGIGFQAAVVKVGPMVDAAAPTNPCSGDDAGAG